MCSNEFDKGPEVAKKTVPRSLLKSLWVIFETKPLCSSGGGGDALELLRSSLAYSKKPISSEFSN